MSRKSNARKKGSRKSAPPRASPQRESKLRRLVGHVALSLGSLLVFFGGSEIVVRLVKPDISLPQSAQHFRFNQSFEFELPHHQRDPTLGWRLVPGTYGRMHINRDGFRGPELTLGSTDSDARRIAHLGDSCTMGFTIADDRAIYPSQLEALLQRAGIPAQTLNFGVDGYSSHQGRLLLDQVLDTHRPEYVTLYFGYNDHHYSNARDRDMRFGGVSTRDLLEKSHAYRFLRRQLLLLLKREARLVEPKRRVDLEAFEDNLRQMVQATRARGSVPILITTPLRPGIPLIENEVRAEIDGRPMWVTQEWWVHRELGTRGLTLQQAAGTDALRDVLADGMQQYPQWSYLHYLHARELERRGDSTAAARALARSAELDAERDVMHAYNERVRRVGRELEVEVLDLAREFVKHPGKLFNDVVHPNAAGHRLIARALAELIQQTESAAP